MTQITISNKCTDVSILEPNSCTAIGGNADYAQNYFCIVRDLRHALNFFILCFQPLTKNLRQWDFMFLGNSFQAIALYFVQSNFIYLFPSHSDLCPQKGYNRFSIAERGSPPGNNREGSCRLYSSESSRANTYEYNTFWGASCTLCTTARPHADMGGGVVEDYLTHIPTGREGYIYLIHAEGTNRYKIGRSVNPIVRASDIQKQSPYPLKIIKSAWTLDAIADEATLHRMYASYRIFGEWFEFENLGDEKGSFWSASKSIVLPPIMFGIAHQSITDLDEFLKLDFTDNPLLRNTMVNICRLYKELRSAPDVWLTQEFFALKLPLILAQSNYNTIPLPASDSLQLEKLSCFINGAIATFKVVGLNKGVGV